MNQPIKQLVIDVDGTLTDGNIIYGDDASEIKAFSVKDGLMLKLLPKLNIEVLLLTGRSSEAVKRRANELNCSLIMSAEKKHKILHDYFTTNGLSWDSTAYIGDDLNDYTAMLPCMFRACPVDAVVEIRDICHYVSPNAGGKGAVRDICEILLKRYGLWECFLKYWTR
jgi:3-deoxy-D-manno-octulosonate 8-phosphate phosphatase (KDO 8-P phosphatase)